MPSIQDYMKQYSAELNTAIPQRAPLDLSGVPTPAPAPAASGKWTDLAVTAGKGIVGAGEVAVGLANLPTFGYAGKALEGIGYRPQETQAALEGLYSPYRQELNRGLAETKGFIPAAQYMLENPSTIGHAILESIPATLGGGAIARGLKTVTPALGVAARAGIGEGAVIAGGLAEGIRQETETGTLSAGQVGSSLVGGAVGGLIGAKGAQIARRFGLPDIDASLAGGAANDVLKPGYLKRIGTAALVEGVFEELPQSAQEQVARNVALGRPFGDGVAEAAAQGMLAGMGMGAGFSATQIRRTPAPQVTDDNLKGTIDEVLAPPAAPAEPLQSEYEQAQREFEIANQTRSEQYPGLRDTPTEELQRMAELLATKKGQEAAGAKDVQEAIAQELAAREPAPETLAQRNDAEIARQMAPEPVPAEVDPLAAEWTQREREIAARNAQVARTAEVLAAQQARAASVTPTAPAATLAADRSMQAIGREVAVNEGRDLFGNLPTAELPAGPVPKRVVALERQLKQLEKRAVAGTATSRDMVEMQQIRDQLGPQATAAPVAAGTTLSPAALIASIPKNSLKGQARAKLAMSPIEDLPNRLFGLWQEKGGPEGGGPAYVAQLDALYQKITGNRIQDHVNLGAQQASAALQGFKEAPTQGRIENVQGQLRAIANLPKQQRRKVMDATLAAIEAGQQPSAALGRNIPEVPTNAVQKPIAAKVDVRQPTQAGRQVAKGDTQKAAAGKGQAAQGEVNVAAPTVVEQGRKGTSDNAPAGTRTGGDRTVGTGGRVRAGTRAPTTGDTQPVVVGSRAGEPATGVETAAEAETVSAYAKPEGRDLELAGYKDAYLNLVKPEKMSREAFTRRKAEYLQSIAEMERNADASNSRKAAKKFLDEQSRFDSPAVKMARRKAEGAVKLVEDVETKLSERNKRIAEKQAAWEAQLQDMDDTNKKSVTAAEKHLAKQFAEYEEDGKPFFSVGTATDGQGMTKEALSKAMRAWFASPTMLDKRVEIVNSEQELPLKLLKALRTVEDGAVGGFYNADQNKVYIIAGNMANEREALAVFLHEVGVHMGMRSLLGPKNYDKLLSQLDVWEKAGTGVEGGLAKKATNRAAKAEAAAKQAPNVDRFNEERLAYFVEEAVLAGIDPTALATQPKSMRQWFSRLWTSLQTALQKLGVRPASLTAEDIVDLAYGSAYLQISDVEQVTAAKAPAVTMFSVKNIGAPETRKALTDFGQVAATANKLQAKLNKVATPDTVTSTLLKGVLSWVTKHHLVQQYDKWFNGGLAMNALADTNQEATSARLNQMFNETYHKLEALERTDSVKFRLIGELMQATELKIDPRKDWAAHTHLHALTGAELTQAQKYVTDSKQKWGRLGATGQNLYNQLVMINETMYTADLAVATYNMVRANPGAQNLEAFKADPTEKFRQSAVVHGSIEAAQKYWRGVLDGYTTALDNYIVEQRGLLPTKETSPETEAAIKEALKGVKDTRTKTRIRNALRTADEKGLNDVERKIARHLSPLEAQLRSVEGAVATFVQSPYFHLGRFGDHFVSFRVRTGVDDLADPKAMAHVQRLLAQEFPDVIIRADATDPHVFARFENEAQAGVFLEMARALQAEGYLMKQGAKDKNNVDLGLILSGSKAEMLSDYRSAGPTWLTRVVESIQAEQYEPDVEKQMIAQMRSLYLDALPDTSSLKVQQKREGRPGWNADMLRNYAHRMRIGSNRVASLASEPTRTQSFAVMKDALARAQESAALNHSDKVKMREVLNEFEHRDRDRMNVPKTQGIDILRSVNHAYFLGMSPSYVLIQMTQLGVLTWPELAKKHGFVKSAKAIAKVTNTAFKIMRTVMAEGWKTRGIKGAADAVITAETLEKAGIDKGTAEFLIKIMASGKMDIGNASRELGRVAEGETQGKVGRHGAEMLKIASMFGYLSETTTRTITALAARELYKGNPESHKGVTVEQYAVSVIDESMLNYNHTNTGRMTGKQGVIGKLSPVAFSFMQYQFQLLEKLYREGYAAVTSDPNVTAEQKAEAKRFFAAHMTSMMTLAGSLGLPFVTAIAAAADKLCEFFSNGYCDSKTAMRNMTSDVFGHDIEPILSRGLPTALGFNISTRAGEADILPFSKFMADKRKMDDSLKELAWSSWGAPSSMVSNFLKGYERISQGDLLGGLQEAVPLALKGPMKAYTMSEKGYTDAAGNVLPMTAGAYDIALQTLGLNPAEKADYAEAKFAQSQRAGALGREGSQIRQKLAAAYEQNDQTSIAKWTEKAVAYDAANPGRGILPRMGVVLQQRAKARAQAEAGGVPLGANMRDVEAQKFTSFYR